MPRGLLIAILALGSPVDIDEDWLTGLSKQSWHKDRIHLLIYSSSASARMKAWAYSCEEYASIALYELNSLRFNGDELEDVTPGVTELLLSSISKAKSLRANYMLMDRMITLAEPGIISNLIESRLPVVAPLLLGEEGPNFILNQDMEEKAQHITQGYIRGYIEVDAVRYCCLVRYGQISRIKVSYEGAPMIRGEVFLDNRTIYGLIRNPCT